MAYVLHRYSWSETSLIVELFTRGMGRVAVAAKGAKRPHSQLRAVLLPFQRINIHLGKTPTDEQAEIHNLRSAEWAGGEAVLGAAAMFSGFYANELLLKMIARQDPHPQLFDAYADTLAALAVAPEGEDSAALRAFELTLLRKVGVLPDLALVTQTASPLKPDASYVLSPDNGLAAHAQGLTGARWLALEAALGHGSMAALRQACVPGNGGLRSQLRALLHYHLGTSLLRTRQVWLDVQKLTEAPSKQ